MPPARSSLGVFVAAIAISNTMRLLRGSLRRKKIASLMFRLFGAVPWWRKVGAIIFAPEVVVWCVLFVRSFFISLIIPYRRCLLYTTDFRFQSLQHRTAHAPNLPIYVDIYLISLSIPISSPVYTFLVMPSHRRNFRAQIKLCRVFISASFLASGSHHSSLLVT